jgi:hypothetical protein
MNVRTVFLCVYSVFRIIIIPPLLHIRLWRPPRHATILTRNASFSQSPSLGRYFCRSKGINSNNAVFQVDHKFFIEQMIIVLQLSSVVGSEILDSTVSL